MLPRPPPEPDGKVDARLAGRMRLAWAVLLWERLWPLLIWPLGVAGSFAALALLDVFSILPAWAHALALTAFAGAFGYLAGRAWSRLRVPTRAEAARRLERDSTLDHRPLAVLEDKRAGGDDPVAEALWQAHRQRMAALIGRLRVDWPHPNMAARDPWGLRAAVILLLAVAVAVGGHDAGTRLAGALRPDLHMSGLGPDSVEVWITPPTYTGAPPVQLRPGPAETDPIIVPAGSTVLAVLAGGWGSASLLIDGAETEFQRQSDGSQRIETQIAAGNRLAVRQAGGTVASWPIQVLPDALPAAEFAVPPEAGERGRLRFDITASDDWGLAKAWVEARRIEDPQGEPLGIDLPLPGSRPRNADMTSWHDLTAHPWAGLPVMLTPVARDALGQNGAGSGVTVTLPERTFTHPVARALVEQRRLLTEDRANAPDAAALIDRVTATPRSIDEDLTVFLALRAARHALMGGFDLAEVQDLLWNSALRLEEGDLAAAEKALEDARRALEQAVDGNAPAAELQQRIEEFQAAMARYLDALAQRMAETGQQPLPPQPGQQVIGQEELEQMMQAMRDMAQTGSNEALKQMLQDLNQMLNSMQAGVPQGPTGPMAKAMQSLADLTRRQQQLLDRSFRQAQQGEGQQGEGQQGEQGQQGRQGGSQGGGGGGAAQTQEGVRRGLGEVMKQMAEGLGEAPAGLGEAQSAMGEAGRELSRGDWGAAAEYQAQAVQKMQEAARQAAEQMGMAGQGGLGLVPRDPLGRPMTGSGFGDDGTTRIPDKSDVQRAREILDELRRRAGDWQRPEPERDYLKRLLRQF